MLRSENNIAIFKALSDDTRLQILEMLVDGERCACKILEELEITQPALSYQMKILTSCGLVKVQKVGTWAHYSLDTEAIDTCTDEVRNTLCSKA
ncbi:MAG: winged helix-turn-helix transcriptional regulator [Actinobacteria bacterium]|nr:winged helix-turn-helix transcriptional regulator [Actinomycetota bacterium]